MTFAAAGRKKDPAFRPGLKWEDDSARL